MTTGNLNRAMMTGALWTIGIRFAMRSLGLISTIILARLLTPQDYGLVAMGSIVVGFIDLLCNFGVATALVQKASVDDEDYHTAWTIQVLQGSLVSVALLILAPWAADYFNEPRVTDVLRVLALAQFISSLDNVGVVAFQKALSFRQDFYLFLVKKLAAFLVSVTIAYVYRTYWALVFGILTGAVMSTLVSYWLHPFRPRFSLTRLKAFWQFSQWLLLRNIAGYAQVRSDSLILGGRSPAETVGAYNIALELADLPSTELVVPITRAILPGFSQLQDDTVAARQTLTRVLALVFLALTPISVGMGLLAEEVVRLLLGDKWLAAIPLLQILAVGSVFMPLRYVGTTVLTATARVRLAALALVAHVLVFLALCLIVFPRAGAESIAWLRVLMTLSLVATILMELRHVGLLAFADLGRQCWRGAVGLGAMGFAVAAAKSLAPEALALRLPLLAAWGGFVYTAGVFGLWWLSGRPEGAERVLWDRWTALTAAFRRRRGKE